MKPIIGLDLDGVIIDNSRIKQEVAKKLGFDLTLKETPAELIKIKLPEETLRKLQKTIYDDPVVSLKSELMPGAEKSLAKIRDSGFKYYLISRRHHPETAIKFLEEKNLWPLYFNEANSVFDFLPLSNYNIE